jgi:hypothetical protein
VQRQLAAHLIEQFGRVSPQPLEVRLAGLIPLPQERDERRRGRDRQCSCVVFGQKSPEAGEQGMVSKPLDRQGSSVAAPGECTTAGGELLATRSSDTPFECAIAF